MSAELARLRKGRGVHSPNVGAVVGTHLRRLCGIGDHDDAVIVRGKLSVRLRALAGALPTDLELAALAALALHPEARHSLLRQRLDWLSAQIGRDERTARRRAGDALDRLAELAVRRVIPDSGDGWTVRRFAAEVRLSAAGCDVTERRIIVAARDGLDRIVASLSLPPHPRAVGGEGEPLVDLTHGGRIVSRERPSQNHFRYVVDLPRALREGEEHEYGLRVRVPAQRRIRPYYVFTPRRPCDRFELTIRFPAGAAPHAVWPVDSAHIRVMDDGPPSSDPIALDRSGAISVQFTDLTPGLCYGARWIPR